jgi:hypothetical protein
MEVEVDEVVAGQRIGVRAASPGQQGGRVRRGGGHRLVRAEPGPLPRIQLKRRRAGTGEQPGTALVQGEPLVEDRPIDDVLDLTSIRLPDGRPAGRRLINQLHTAGFTYDPRHHRIGRTGGSDVHLPYTYLGADDRTGANYTGQPAVSYYNEDPHPPT